MATSKLVPRISFLLSAVLLVTLVVGSVAFAVGGSGAVQSITEYKLPEQTGSPWSVARGPDGAMWYTKSASRIGKITASGQVTEFKCPYTGGSPWGITAGPDGNMWFTEEFSQENTTGGQFGRITPAGSVKMFRPLAGYHDLRSITTGPDGALWFTDDGETPRVGRLTTAGVATEFPCGSGNWPADIITGPDGALWFTNTDRICRMTTSGQLKEFLVGELNTSVSGLAAGPDGALWFTQIWSSPQNPSIERAYVIRMTTSGAMTRYEVGNSLAWPGKITAGADGAMWFTELRGDSQGFVVRNFGRMTMTGGYTEYCTPGATMCTDIAAGPSGTVWLMSEIPEGYGIAAKIVTDPIVPPASQWKSTGYFAEGWTGAGFLEYACIQNPNASPASVWLTYMTSQGVTDTQYLYLQPTSRQTVDVNQLVGPDKEVSLRVVSTSAGIVAERPMYFNYKGKWTGGHDVMSVPAPGRTFYFAEGSCRPGFEPYYCVMNPGDLDADVTITYMTGDGKSTHQDGIIEPHSRYTFRPADRLGVADDVAHDFSAKVECVNGQGIVCERPMYFNYGGAWTGGHDVTGLAEPAGQFYFAEGTCRPDFETYFCILNPGDTKADVRIDYSTGDAHQKSQTVSVGKKSRTTVKVKDFLGEAADAAHDFSATVTCTNGQKIVCERPMYFNYMGNWTGGHDVMGATALSKKYDFAEGNSRPNMQQYFSVWNPDSDPIGLRIVYMFTDGTVLEQIQDVESRTTINCRDFLAGHGKLGCDFSAVIDDNAFGKPFLVERPMYFDYQGWTGGSNVVGAPAP